MVELLLTLLVLYGLQCVVLLPRGGTLFVRPGARWSASEGPGWRLLHPWPSAGAWLASRPPLLVHGDGWRTRGPTPWLGASFAEQDGVRLVPGGGQTVALRGQTVRVDGAPALRAPTRREAARLAKRLAALTGPDADADAWLDDGLAGAFDAGALADAYAGADAATRWLGYGSDAGLVVLGIGLPTFAAIEGGERALLFLAPAYLVLHGVLLFLLGRAYGALHAGEGGRFELLFSAALYPPLLLRAASELKREALCGFHPAAVAAEVLPRDEALDRLRAELARPLPERERAAIAGVVERLGSSSDELFAPPERSDPLARAFCATCRTEYRRAEGDCIDCGAALEPFAAEGSPLEAPPHASP